MGCASLSRGRKPRRNISQPEAFRPQNNANIHLAAHRTPASPITFEKHNFLPSSPPLEAAVATFRWYFLAAGGAAPFVLCCSLRARRAGGGGSPQPRKKSFSRPFPEAAVEPQRSQRARGAHRPAPSPLPQRRIGREAVRQWQAPPLQGFPPSTAHAWVGEEEVGAMATRRGR